MFQEIFGLLLSIISVFGISIFYIYLSKYYTIEKVKKLELQLSEIQDITDEERNLLISVREYLIKSN
tara:strand:+ start:111 stop:311 length:201 start_codon:yes stop_codon:yes gene_type:complete